MPWLAVADDLTGANDLAGRLSGRGTRVWVSQRPEALRGLQATMVLDAETRFLGPARARQAVQAAWAALPGGAALRFQKIDSTLRGNPGEEIEGLVLATGARSVAVLPAYPAMGRVTRGGEVYVHGQRLDRSEFSQDPLTPARAHRPADLFPRSLRAHASLTLVAAGPARLKAWLLRQRSAGARFITFDCVSEPQVATIAQACLAAGIRHFAGASGLAGALAEKAWGPASPVTPPRSLKWMLLVGTVSARSFEQLRALEASRAAHWHPLLQQHGRRWSRMGPGRAKGLRKAWGRERAVALSSLARREDLPLWRAKEGRAGRNPGQVAQTALSELVELGLGMAPLGAGNAYFVTGGHTLATFFSHAGLARFGVLGEALPGLPVGMAEGPQGRCWMASKPGGFGSADLFERFLRL